MRSIVKVFCMISVVLVTVLGFNSCEKNDVSGTISLEGKWLTISDDWTELLFINEDNTFTSTGTDGVDIWNGIKGRIEITGDNFKLISEDGDNSIGKFKFEDKKFTLIIDDISYVYTKLNEDISVVGKWDCVKIESYIKALKDELELPVGSVVNGEVIPATINIENLKGEFLEKAIEAYFKNTEFTKDGKLNYSVVKEEEEVNMSKNYTLGNNLMTVSGKVGSVEINNSFMTFQKFDKSVTYLFLTKQNIADMFIAYAMMLRESGVSEGTDDALEDFKNEFMETFENYAVVISLESR